MPAGYGIFIYFNYYLQIVFASEKQSPETFVKGISQKNLS